MYIVIRQVLFYRVLIQKVPVAAETEQYGVDQSSSSMIISLLFEAVKFLNFTVVVLRALYIKEWHHQLNTVYIFDYINFKVLKPQLLQLCML